ncbi:nicotinamide riboside transporter PnuC [Sandarakinorhabdus sp.]|uniref:nicotinamide riboside transporter PnuC n=1 Tax=Sandarakinorhabdus sp. TaxID=1916663 RepID=UPI0028B07615|nr:nicotinamide riboside transporter PnuC [Sandarakinorhabdus sp.]
MNPWELAASAFGLANIMLLARRSVWNYPCGMAMVAIFAFVFWNSRLYAVAGLQVFFFLSQAQGLWMWLRAPADAGQVAVRRLPAMGWPVVLISGVIGSAVLAMLLAQTDAAAPVTDGAVAGWSLVAQVLINLRMLESWPLWVGINIVSVGLYASQALWVTAALYVVFLAGAIWSWRLWLAAERAEA